ncbi:hypothetical protein [Thioclava sp. DLFJ4-1]|uniref:hypothetical protein n=1 Tax=Thioclava sp. DLFJ4-1 TaxID=1915313 RepID=UPI000998CCCC|nr:hypothetical protein [Thioclava sp. DLFJ4-1]OOY15095.1 hypothetical protein BMI85_16240 [Thioclava sp. DLFJ4-1]
MISMDKEYRYRNGGPARVLCVDASGTQPVITLTKDGIVRRHYPDGKWTDSDEMPYDLIEVKPRIKREYWCNLYPNGNAAMYMVRENADHVYTPERLACVKVTIDCEEGEGL